MKVGIYSIINDPLPQLFEMQTIDVNKSDFSSDGKIVNMLRNKLKIDKMDSEFAYALSLSYDLTPRGILLIAIGNNQRHTENIRGLGIGLLLTGAEQFMVFHNHPGGNKNVSIGDINITRRYSELGSTLGIDFIRHIMIAKDYYVDCAKGV